MYERLAPEMVESEIIPLDKSAPKKFVFDRLTEENTELVKSDLTNLALERLVFVKLVSLKSA